MDHCSFPFSPEHESLDRLGCSGLRIFQPASGARFSLDPLLLCAFCRCKPGEIAADLGSGTGIVPLLLSQREPTLQIHGIEIQPAMADRAQRSVALNGLAGRITIHTGDLRHCNGMLPPQSCDIVLCNPPYRRTNSGRIAPTAERAISRHELHGNLADFVTASRFLLKQGGRFYTVMLAERLAELLNLLQQARIEPKRLRCVHSRSNDPAALVLVEGRRNGRPGCNIEAPLVLYTGDDYSKEALELLGVTGAGDGRIKGE